jgi:hypothetical protein
MKLHLLLAVPLLACSPVRPVPTNEVAAEQPDPTKGEPVASNEQAGAATGEGVANLPFSHGRRFHTLDEYLAHLRENAAPIDQPWWREIRPGVYEHVKRMPGATREIATRAELKKRFGFSS